MLPYNARWCPSPLALSNLQWEAIKQKCNISSKLLSMTGWKMEVKCHPGRSRYHFKFEVWKVIFSSNFHLTQKPSLPWLLPRYHAPSSTPMLPQKAWRLPNQPSSRLPKQHATWIDDWAGKFGGSEGDLTVSAVESHQLGPKKTTGNQVLYPHACTKIANHDLTPSPDATLKKKLK